MSKSFGKLGEDFKVSNTKFILRSINTQQLDKQYILQELTDINSTLFAQQFANETNENNCTPNQQNQSNTALHTTLENIGISKTMTKPIDTIVLNDDIVLKLFISPSKQKNIKCWFCRLSIPNEWSPLGIPIKYIEKTKKFHTEGSFCSFNCISSYITDNSSTFRYKDSGPLLFLMYRMIFKNPVPIMQIKQAPSWKLLKEYGGHLDVEEYRKSLQYLEYKNMNQTIFLPCVELFNET